MGRLAPALLVVLALGACGDPALPPEILPTEPEDVRVVRGRALLTDGSGELRPLPGIRLAAFYSDSRWDLVTDSEGRFTFDGIPFVDFYVEICESKYAFAVDYAYMGGNCVTHPVGTTDRNVDLVFAPISLIERLLEDGWSCIPPRAPPPPGARFTIEGRVLDEEGAALAGADVLAEGTGRHAMTDETGSFHLTGLRQVGHDLRVTCEERAFPLARGIDGGTLGVEIRALEGASIAGVLRGPTGDPFPGVEVVATPDPGPELLPNPSHAQLEHERSGRTDRGGRFRIGGLSECAHAVRCTGGGMNYSGEWRRGVPAGTRDLVLAGEVSHFETAMRIAGTVRDLNGQPVAGVGITVRPEGFRGPALTDESSDDGRFCVMGLAAGYHRVTADHPGSGAEVRYVMTGACDVELVVD